MGGDLTLALHGILRARDVGLRRRRDRGDGHRVRHDARDHRGDFLLQHSYIPSFNTKFYFVYTQLCL